MYIEYADGVLVWPGVASTNGVGTSCVIRGHTSAQRCGQTREVWPAGVGMSAGASAQAREVVYTEPTPPDRVSPSTYSPHAGA